MLTIDSLFTNNKKDRGYSVFALRDTILNNVPPQEAHFPFKMGVPFLNSDFSGDSITCFDLHFKQYAFISSIFALYYYLILIIYPTFSLYHSKIRLSSNCPSWGKTEILDKILRICYYTDESTKFIN